MTDAVENQTGPSIDDLARAMCAGIGVNPKTTGRLSRAEQGPSTKKVKVPRPDSAERNAAPAAIMASASLKVGDEVRVKLEEKPGNPRLKVTALTFDGQTFNLDEAEADAEMAEMEASHARIMAQKQPAADASDWAKGNLKWFNHTKGYGFIAPDAGGKDEFLHISVVERKLGKGFSLPDGTPITYKLGEHRGRLVVVDFEVLKG